MHTDGILWQALFLLSWLAVVLVWGAGEHPRLRRPGWIAWGGAMVLLAVGIAAA